MCGLAGRQGSFSRQCYGKAAWCWSSNEARVGGYELPQRKLFSRSPGNVALGTSIEAAAAPEPRGWRLAGT